VRTKAVTADYYRFMGSRSRLLAVMADLPDVAGDAAAVAAGAMHTPGAVLVRYRKAQATLMARVIVTSGNNQDRQLVFLTLPDQ
jgi:hypothetical protein